MKEESVRVKNGCGKLLRACSSAKVSIKEGWKGLAEVGGRVKLQVKIVGAAIGEAVWLQVGGVADVGRWCGGSC